MSAAAVYYFMYESIPDDIFYLVILGFVALALQIVFEIALDWWRGRHD